MAQLPNTPTMQDPNATPDPATVPTLTGGSPEGSAVPTPPSAVAGQQPQPTPPPATSFTPITQEPSLAARAAHSILSAVNGYRTDYQVGPDGKMQETQVKDKPGALFRHILAGAILGGAAASEAHNQNPNMGFGAGAVTGGAAGVKENQQENLLKRKQAEEDFERQQKADLQKQQLGIEERRIKDQEAMTRANVEHLNREDLMTAKDFNLRTQEALEKHNQFSFEKDKWAAEAGGRLAPVPENGQPGNAKTLMADFAKNPSRYNPPQGYSRMLTTSVDMTGLKYNEKGSGWEDSNGKPVDLDTRTTASLYFVPTDSAKQPTMISGAQLMKNFPNILKGSLNPESQYAVDFDKLAALGGQESKISREGWEEAFKTKHEELMDLFKVGSENIRALKERGNTLNDKLRSAEVEGNTPEATRIRGQLDDINNEITDSQKTVSEALAGMNPHYAAGLKEQYKRENARATAAQKQHDEQTQRDIEGMADRLKGEDEGTRAARLQGLRPDIREAVSKILSKYPAPESAGQKIMKGIGTAVSAMPSIPGVISRIKGEGQ